jgi:hypothetical protein
MNTKLEREKEAVTLKLLEKIAAEAEKMNLANQMYVFTFAVSLFVYISVVSVFDYLFIC